MCNLALAFATWFFCELLDICKILTCESRESTWPCSLIIYSISMVPGGRDGPILCTTTPPPQGSRYLSNDQDHNQDQEHDFGKSFASRSRQNQETPERVSSLLSGAARGTWAADDMHGQSTQPTINGPPVTAERLGLVSDKLPRGVDFERYGTPAKGLF